MLRASLYFIQLALLIALAIWLSDNPGQVTIEWLGYRIDTYFAVVLAVVGMAAVVLVWLVRLLLRMLNAPGSFFAGRATRTREAGYKALMIGMAAVAAGDAAEAKRMSRRADSLLHDPSLTRLLQAQAAALNGDAEAATRYFQALRQDADTAFLGATGLMRLALDRGDREEALRLAEEAHAENVSSTAILETLLDLQVRAGRWREAQATLFEAVRRGLIAEAPGRSHRTAILMERARAAATAGEAETALDHVDKALEASPGFVPAAIFKAALLKKTDRLRRAQRLLEETWQRAPHRELARAYVQLWPDDAPLERLKRVQRLTVGTDHDETRIALAEAALAADLWGEARRHVEAIAGEHRTAGVLRLLARIEEAEHGDIAGARALLERAAAAPPDPAWTCTGCGAVADSWSGLCGNCGSFDTLVWKQPPRISLLPPAVIEETAAAEPEKLVEHREPA